MACLVVPAPAGFEIPPRRTSVVERVNAGHQHGHGHGVYPQRPEGYHNGAANALAAAAFFPPHGVFLGDPWVGGVYPPGARPSVLAVPQYHIAPSFVARQTVGQTVGAVSGWVSAPPTLSVPFFAPQSHPPLSPLLAVAETPWRTSAPGGPLDVMPVPLAAIAVTAAVPVPPPRSVDPVPVPPAPVLALPSPPPPPAMAVMQPAARRKKKTIFGKRKPRTSCWPWGKRRARLLLDQDVDEREFLNLDGVQCPSYWTNQDVSIGFSERFPVSEETTKAIQSVLDGTWLARGTRDREGTVPLGGQVIDVQRIEDRDMWVVYHNQKERIRRNRGQCQAVPGLVGSPSCGVADSLPPRPVKTMVATCGDDSSLLSDCLSRRLEGDLNEYYLWHGTAPGKANSIVEEGFCLDLSGSNRGKMYGRGAYFAECSSKADEYAADGDLLYRGIYCMLLCRVVCGQLKVLTLKDAQAAEDAVTGGEYDGILGDREASVGTYREFVVFRERQIYPEYAVLYRRRRASTV